MQIPIVADTKVKVLHRAPDGVAYPINGEWPALPAIAKPVPVPNAGKLIVILSVSRKDVDLACRWLGRWKATGSAPLVLVMSSAIEPEDKHKLLEFETAAVVCIETTDGTYPRAANHQFLCGLKYCERTYPGWPILFCEPDTFLVRPKWYEEISQEYAECGKPFLGHAVKDHMVPHIAGCCVYPPNWRELAPALAFLDAMPWKDAWDTACAHEIYPQAAKAKTIYQIWRPAHLVPEVIPTDCALFHQDKTGCLYDLIPLEPKATATMKVYTYWQPVDGLQDPELLELWKASWARHGWEPIVLTEADAIAANPEMFERFKRSPLMHSHPGNPEAYTFACLARWVAMTAIEEPCMHVDWDVMNRGWTPEDTEELSVTKPTFLASGRCPCAVFANGEGWRALARVLELIPYRHEFLPDELAKDASDQYAFSIMSEVWLIEHPDRPCRDYNRGEGWQDSPLAHFPNATTPYPRSACVKRNGFSL